MCLVCGYWISLFRCLCCGCVCDAVAFCVVFVFGMMFRCLDAGLALVGCGCVWYLLACWFGAFDDWFSGFWLRALLVGLMCDGNVSRLCVGLLVAIVVCSLILVGFVLLC